jgi:uncharacterized protein (TIGR02594 family)
MTDVGLVTIYTDVEESWESLQQRLGISCEEIVNLNSHLMDVDEIEPGIPIDVPLEAEERLLADGRWFRQNRGKSPYEIAKAELLMDIAQIPGKKDNPRITLYHSTTIGGAQPDEVAWCSSFVNYCVQQSGLKGTRSKAARSWHNTGWGVPVSKNEWREGDIIVFWRVAEKHWKGHVGFLVAWDGSRPAVLGGNQGNRLSIARPYPFKNILSVRRAA